MRISDLSRQTGVPVPTIKFYLREGLLFPGTPTARNQANYGEKHLRRLRLIRALTNIVHLDLSSVHEILHAVEDEQIPLQDLYAVVARTLSPTHGEVRSTGQVADTRASVDRFIAERGWRVEPDAPARDMLAQVLAALKSLGCEADISFFAPHAAAAEKLAAHELSLLPTDGAAVDRGAVAARAALFEAVLAAIRGMAREHRLARWPHHPAQDRTPAQDQPPVQDHSRA